jgi:5'-nucleotidase (lipoprotein e(P4) family)
MNRGVEISSNLLARIRQVMIGFMLSGFGCNVVAAQEKAFETTLKMESPPSRGLDANLYMQTSAEYRACCLQAFSWARKSLAEKFTQRIRSSEKSPLAHPSKVASQSATPLKPPAIILDLDETVFDNRAFQTKQIREGWAYSQVQWSQFEQHGGADVVAIPGAIEFLSYARSLGVQPVYITNRNANAHQQTLEILKRLQIEVPADLLLCADANTKSSKDSRRALVRERFDVLLLIGDNLRDFEDFFKYDGSQGAGPGIEQRKATVDGHQAKFGHDWILLPNPAYGEWNKALGNGIDDAKLLSPQQP